eukprot:6188413-Pleurochrysis_carterae.AAC.2
MSNNFSFKPQSCARALVCARACGCVRVRVRSCVRACVRVSRRVRANASSHTCSNGCIERRFIREKQREAIHQMPSREAEALDRWLRRGSIDVCAPNRSASTDGKRESAFITNLIESARAAASRVLRRRDSTKDGKAEQPAAEMERGEGERTLQRAERGGKGACPAKKSRGGCDQRRKRPMK